MREELKPIIQELVVLCENYRATLPPPSDEPVNLGRLLPDAPELSRARENIPEWQALRRFLAGLPKQDLGDLAVEM